MAEVVVMGRGSYGSGNGGSNGFGGFGGNCGSGHGYSSRGGCGCGGGGGDMKEETWMAVTMVVVVTILILEIIVDNSNQVMDPRMNAVLEDAQVVCMVVAVDLVAEGLTDRRKWRQKKAGSCQESRRLL